MKVLFCGDLVPTDDNRQLFAQGDPAPLFSDAAQLFSRSDYSMVNLECAITESEEPISKIGPPLKAPLQTAALLARVGVTHCNLSNNHFFDFGPRGAADSLQALERAGVGTTGFGENEADAQRELILEKDGETLCVIAVCEHEYSYALPDRMGTRAFDPFDTPLAVRAAKEKYHRVAVLYHGGKEQCAYPSPRLLKACRALAKSGADLVLCQHSHCIGCYEEFEGCHILYGQGNFHFIREKNREMPQWHQGLAALYDTASGRLELIPVTSDPGCPGIRLAGEGEKSRILEELSLRSRSLEDGTWQQGWRDFCLGAQNNYRKTVANAYAEGCSELAKEKFAHYLDCEAHTDVWRELFRTQHRRGG